MGDTTLNTPDKVHFLLNCLDVTESLHCYAACKNCSFHAGTALLLDHLACLALLPAIGNLVVDPADQSREVVGNCTDIGHVVDFGE